MKSMWLRLGLPGPPDDRRMLKRAYAKRLKVCRPDEDPAGFQAVRDAYDWALKYFDNVEAYGPPPDISAIDGDDQDSACITAPETAKARTRDPVILPSAEKDDFQDQNTRSEAGRNRPEEPVILTPVGQDEFGEDLKDSADETSLGFNINEFIRVKERINDLLDRKSRRFATDDWRKVLDDPALSSIDLSQAVESFVLYRIIEICERHPTDPSDLFEKDFAELIDDHFEWVRDGVGLVGRTDETAWLVILALSDTGYKPAELSDHVAFYHQKLPVLLRGEVIITLALIVSAVRLLV